MTALKEYERLESGGLWREGPEAQRRDVVVSFGKATLVFSDTAGRPLAHWSLPALVRQNPGERPALYAPGPDGDETLEVADDLMIDAIEKVRQAVRRDQPRPGHLRSAVLGGAALVVLAAAVFWLPDALKRQAIAAVPQATQGEFGAILLGQLMRNGAERCQSERGEAAAAALHRRLLGAEAPGQIVVLDWQGPPAIELPGRLILLNAGDLQASGEPAVVAGHILAARTNARHADPMEPLLDHAGLRALMRLLTQGDIEISTVASYAATLETVDLALHIDTLTQAFDMAAVPGAPYAAATNHPDAGRLLNVRSDGGPQILSDSAWISLQGICDF